MMGDPLHSSPLTLECSYTQDMQRLHRRPRETSQLSAPLLSMLATQDKRTCRQHENTSTNSSGVYVKSWLCHDKNVIIHIMCSEFPLNSSWFCSCVVNCCKQFVRCCRCWRSLPERGNTVDDTGMLMIEGKLLMIEGDVVDE